MSAQPQIHDIGIDAEQCVIGSLLIDPTAYFRICGLVQGSDFYRREHRLIFNAIADMVQNGGEPDCVTICEYLGDEADAAGGLAYVGELSANTPSSANAPAYARIVRDKSVSRQVRLSLSNAIESLEQESAEDVITATMTSLQNLMQTGGKSVTLAEAIDQAITAAKVAERRRATGTLAGISTTIPTLDRLTGGIHGPRLIVLGGRPGTYKSAFAWQIAYRAAAKGKPAGIVSLEMDAAELGERVLANTMKINGHAFATGHSETVRTVENGLPPGMTSWPVYIDTQSNKLGQIMSRIIEWKYRHKIELAVVDHVQLVHHDRARNRFEELSEISRSMKLLAMRLQMPIILLSQLSRDVVKDGRRPRDADLRECGNLEQDADWIIFLHCEAGKGQIGDYFELILSKQRGGPAREVIPLVVNGEHYLVGEGA